MYIIQYVYASRQNRTGVFEVNCCSSFSLVVVHMRWADCNNVQNELHKHKMSRYFARFFTMLKAASLWRKLFL